MLDNSLAIRYADALYNAVCKNGVLSTAQQELNAVCVQLLDTANVKKILFHPAIPASEKKSFCNQLIGSVVSPLILNFVNILIDSDKLSWACR
jgi:F0F1-type ATP synthase delta subunit